MSRYSKRSIPLLVLLAAAVFAPIASAGPRVFIGGYFGPGYYGPAYYGFGPAWYGPGVPYGYAYGPSAGKVKIDTKMKDAAVYVDGAYAGTVRQLKTFILRPGAHNIELRDPSGRAFYQERIDVIAGKTLKLAA
jgi:hypothetical protein